MRGCPRARHLKLPPNCLPVMPGQGLTHGGWRSQLRERWQLPRQALTLKGILSETGFQGSRTLAQQTFAQKTQVLSQGQWPCWGRGGHVLGPQGEARRMEKGPAWVRTTPAMKDTSSSFPHCLHAGAETLNSSAPRRLICKMKLLPLRFQMPGGPCKTPPAKYQHAAQNAAARVNPDLKNSPLS